MFREQLNTAVLQAYEAKLEQMAERGSEMCIRDRLSPDMEERAALIIDCGKEVSNLARRMAELAAGDTAGRRTDHARITAAPER